LKGFSIINYCKLTICFENPFWIGLVETESEGDYQVAKHVFGSEPSDPEVEEFIREHWQELHFTEALQVEKTEGKKLNHKRMQRVIAKEIAAHARKGTKAQQALSEERESNKLERRNESKSQREAEQKERFNKRTERRKQKHRGH
jgi:hypothetical protein